MVTTSKALDSKIESGNLSLYPKLAIGINTFFSSATDKVLSSKNHLIAIDNSDQAGKIASLFRYGEVSVKSIDDLIIKVVSNSSITPLTSLTIIGHNGLTQRARIRREANSNVKITGEDIGFSVGTDFISLINFPSYAIKLTKIRHLFTEDGYIHLCACKLGHNPQLLKALAKSVNVTVCAGLGLDNAVGFNHGDYIAVTPDGNTHKFSNRSDIRDYR